MARAVQYDDIDSEHATRLTNMIMRLFEHWKLTYEEQAKLLDFSSKTHSTINRYKNGTSAIRFDRDTYDRVRFLLAIHKLLRMLFPMNLELAYAWPKTTNQFFHGRTPVEVVFEEGFLGLVRVHDYLENQKMQ
ncbi:MAG: hypothetical protein P1U34_10905 [Coxiellaceae bacterium]|nr:hypothetical protein [Coxiellaceae bacterium]